MTIPLHLFAPHMSALQRAYVLDAMQQVPAGRHGAFVDAVKAAAPSTNAQVTAAVQSAFTSVGATFRSQLVKTVLT
jgi:hypothetical protein